MVRGKRARTILTTPMCTPMRKPTGGSCARAASTSKLNKESRYSQRAIPAKCQHPHPKPTKKIHVPEFWASVLKAHCAHMHLRGHVAKKALYTKLSALEPFAAICQ
eukprot:2207199-Amphidinium_carterae.1